MQPFLLLGTHLTATLKPTVGRSLVIFKLGGERSDSSPPPIKSLDAQRWTLDDSLVLRWQVPLSEAFAQIRAAHHRDRMWLGQCELTRPTASPPINFS